MKQVLTKQPKLQTGKEKEVDSLSVSVQEFSSKPGRASQTDVSIL